MDTNIDVSRPAQIRDIEATFATSSNDSFDLSTIRHPIRKDLTAVESFEILPDAEIWANAYDLFRFSERPGDRPPDVGHHITKTLTRGLFADCAYRWKTPGWTPRCSDRWNPTGTTSSRTTSPKTTTPPSPSNPSASKPHPAAPIPLSVFFHLPPTSKD